MPGSIPIRILAAGGGEGLGGLWALGRCGSLVALSDLVVPNAEASKGEGGGCSHSDLLMQMLFCMLLLA